MVSLQYFKLPELNINTRLVLYRNKGDLKSTFVKSTQDVLQRVAEVAEVAFDLNKYFPVPEHEAMSGISRVSGYLNLLYHQVGSFVPRIFLPNIGFSVSCLQPVHSYSCSSRSEPNQQIQRSLNPSKWKSPRRSICFCRFASSQRQRLHISWNLFNNRTL